MEYDKANAFANLVRLLYKMEIVNYAQLDDFADYLTLRIYRGP